MVPTDKQYLQAIVREVLNNLRRQPLSGPFRIAKRWRALEANSGGWAVRLGTFRGYRSWAEIWLDQFTAHAGRKIYYGVFSRDPNQITRLVRLASPHLGGQISRYGYHWSDNIHGVQLSRPLAIKDFGHPLFERYPEFNDYFYGVYELEKRSLKSKETRKLTKRALEFVRTVNNVLSQERMRQEAESYQGVENQKAVQRHLQRERNRYLTLLSKQRDKYVCKICGFDFYEAYGDLGKDFAEAHHVVPLSTNDKKRITTVDDLITVCANCHRMLGLMKGEAGDVAKLKAIVRRHRAVDPS